MLFAALCNYKFASTNLQLTGCTIFYFYFLLFLKIFIYLAVLVLHCGTREACVIQFPDRGSTGAPCFGSAESQPLDHQGSPWMYYFALRTLASKLTASLSKMQWLRRQLHNTFVGLKPLTRESQQGALLDSLGPDAVKPRGLWDLQFFLHHFGFMNYISQNANIAVLSLLGVKCPLSCGR